MIRDHVIAGHPTSTARSSARCGRRIAVVGTTGSGKTMLARQIAQRLAITHVELDAVHWGPNWTPIPIEIFREHTAQALSGDAWVVDGNYGKVRDIVWHRADTVVWLDYALPVILGRLLWRTLRRTITQEELWHGNRERFLTQFSSRDSLFLWALRTYPRRRREYPMLFKEPEYVHLAVVHLRSPRAARAWLAGLSEVMGR
jgi:adenylate kinase family enzyme